MKGRGKGIMWIRDHAGYDGDECLIWPYSRNPETGYGTFGLDGFLYYAHRYMCELVNGPEPSERHQSAHSCGNGHLGCVTPRHLSWKTISENQLDKHIHGTRRLLDRRLTTGQVAEVRALKGKMSQYDIARKFGVGRGCIQYWHRHDREPERTEQNSPRTLRRRAMIERVRQSLARD